MWPSSGRSAVSDSIPPRSSPLPFASPSSLLPFAFHPSYFTSFPLPFTSSPLPFASPLSPSFTLPAVLELTLGQDFSRVEDLAGMCDMQAKKSLIARVRGDYERAEDCAQEYLALSQAFDGGLEEEMAKTDII
ncbi:hypothetical protein BDY21DRAFT_357217, partial [Lineolata rhizophorae]